MDELGDKFWINSLKALSIAHQMKQFGPKKFHARFKEFWQYFRKGWDGRAQLVQPSKSNHGNRKILFVLGFYQYLERLEGKIRDCISFSVNKSDYYSENMNLKLF